MAQEIDKIIKSTTPPKSKDVLWDNGKELLINRNGKWEPTSASKVNTITPDWNAQIGEEGYIKNRTHYYDNSRLFPFDLSNADITYDDNGNISKVIFHSITYSNNGFFIVNTFNLTQGYSLSDSIFLQKENINSVHNVFFSSYLKENDDYTYDLVCIDFLEGDSIDYIFSVIKYTVEIEGFIKTLDEKYIPNTIARKSDIPTDIIKTTPQTLSNANKNQALANLGIDPVVWKYLCNPHIIEWELKGDLFSNPIPKELSDIIYQNGKFNHLVLSTILIKKYDAEFPDVWDVIRVTSYDNEGCASFGVSTFTYDANTRLFVI